MTLNQTCPTKTGASSGRGQLHVSSNCQVDILPRLVSPSAESDGERRVVAENRFQAVKEGGGGCRGY